MIRGADEPDEIDAEKNRLAGQVEEAFADARYPGDDNLVKDPLDRESRGIARDFQGKHWKDLSVETLSRQRWCLSFLTPEAFRFYLPACVLASLLHDEIDTLWESVFFHLTPPVSEDPGKIRRFEERIEGLSPRQVSALREFVKLYARLEHSDPNGRRGVEFWESLVPGKPGPT